MSGPVLKWAGGTLFAGAAIGMGVYFARVGLAEADQTASVIGAFIGLAGLALTIYGILRQHRQAAPPSPAEHAQTIHGPGDTRNTVHGGTFHGPVIQGRDISGPLEPPSPHETASEHRS